jgi:hypothetical protein
MAVPDLSIVNEFMEDIVETLTRPGGEISPTLHSVAGVSDEYDFPAHPLFRTGRHLHIDLSIKRFWLVERRDDAFLVGYSQDVARLGCYPPTNNPERAVKYLLASGLPKPLAAQWIYTEPANMKGWYQAAAVDKTGFVYAAKNAALPGLVKIGKTTDVDRRLDKLSSNTAVPEPFRLIEAARVWNMDYAETIIHNEFNTYRHRSDREFFRIHSDRARAAIYQLAPIFTDGSDPFGGW